MIGADERAERRQHDGDEDERRNNITPRRHHQHGDHQEHEHHRHDRPRQHAHAGERHDDKNKRDLDNKKRREPGLARVVLKRPKAFVGGFYRRTHRHRFTSKLAEPSAFFARAPNVFASPVCAMMQAGLSAHLAAPLPGYMAAPFCRYFYSSSTAVTGTWSEDRLALR